MFSRSQSAKHVLNSIVRCVHTYIYSRYTDPLLEKNKIMIKFFFFRFFDIIYLKLNHYLFIKHQVEGNISNFSL